jgi:hypothetical protein
VEELKFLTYFVANVNVFFCHEMYNKYFVLEKFSAPGIYVYSIIAL